MMKLESSDQDTNKDQSPKPKDQKPNNQD